MTTRDRREARAERLRSWADSNDAKSTAAGTTAGTMADAIPFGQPILVGHYSEGRDRRYRARMVANMDKAVAHGRKADEQRSRADNIERAADAAIYDDDPDVLDRLAAKLDRLEAERARVKAYNASCRKGTPDLDALDDRQREEVADLRRIAFLRPGGAFPPYVLSNLGGTITTTRQRLARLTAAKAAGPAKAGRLITARYAGTCDDCAEPIEVGQTIRYARGVGTSHAHHTEESTR